MRSIAFTKENFNPFTNYAWQDCGDQRKASSVHNFGEFHLRAETWLLILEIFWDYLIFKYLESILLSNQ